MAWREVVEAYYKDWGEAHKADMLKALAKENDLAEALGFNCVPDDRRGFGQCAFTRDDVRVWCCGLCWARARVIDGHYKYHLYYRNLRHALQNTSAFARLGTPGVKVYFKTEAEARESQQAHNDASNENLQIAAD